jgi:hypothetical protein
LACKELERLVASFNVHAQVSGEYEPTTRAYASRSLRERSLLSRSRVDWAIVSTSLGGASIGAGYKNK